MDPPSRQGLPARRDGASPRRRPARPWLRGAAQPSMEATGIRGREVHSSSCIHAPPTTSAKPPTPGGGLAKAPGSTADATNTTYYTRTHTSARPYAAGCIEHPSPPARRARASVAADCWRRRRVGQKPRRLGRSWHAAVQAVGSRRPPARHAGQLQPKPCRRVPASVRPCMHAACASHALHMFG